MLSTIAVPRLAEATVADSGTVSTAVDIGGYRYVGVVVPAGFEGTTITFQVSADGTTYVPLEVAAGTAVSFTTNASSGFSLGDEIRPWAYMKLVCGTAQTGAAVFQLSLKS